jgi:hypothetical protein
MAAKEIQRVTGHWRVTLFYAHEDGSILFCVDECIFCNFRTRADNRASRIQQMVEHEKTHPEEAEARDLYKFRQGLDAALMETCCYYGIDVLTFIDREEYELHFSRFQRDDSARAWGDYITSVFVGAKEWKRPNIDRK